MHLHLVAILIDISQLRYFWIKKNLLSRGNSELWIHQMNLFTYIIDALIVSQKVTGLEVSRECLMVLDEQG